MKEKDFLKDVISQEYGSKAPDLSAEEVLNKSTSTGAVVHSRGKILTGAAALAAAAVMVGGAYLFGSRLSPASNTADDLVSQSEKTPLATVTSAAPEQPPAQTTATVGEQPVPPQTTVPDKIWQNGNTKVKTPLKPLNVSELKTVSAAELKSDTDEAIAQMRSLFNIRSGELTPQLPTELYECSFAWQQGMEKRFEEIASKLYDKELLSRVTILNNDVADNDDASAGTDKVYLTPVKGFRSGDLKEHCFLHGNGFLCFFRPSAFSFSDSGMLVNIYFPDRDDLSARYQLKDGEMTVAEAVSFAQSWIDENYAYLEPDYTFKVKDVVVRCGASDICYFEIDVEKSYKGVHLNSAVTVTGSSADAIMEQVTNTLTLQMINVDEISMFTNNNGMVVPTETKKLDQIISLSSLLPYIKETFSEALAVGEISEIGLKYTLSPQYDYANGQHYYHPGVSVNSRLVWEILVDVPVAGRTGGSYSGRIVNYIQIDALTGEVEYDFDPNTN